MDANPYHSPEAVKSEFRSETAATGAWSSVAERILQFGQRASVQAFVGLVGIVSVMHFGMSIWIWWVVLFGSYFPRIRWEILSPDWVRIVFECMGPAVAFFMLSMCVVVAAVARKRWSIVLLALLIVSSVSVFIYDIHTYHNAMHFFADKSFYDEYGSCRYPLWWWHYTR